MEFKKKTTQKGARRFGKTVAEVPAAISQLAPGFSEQ